MKLTNTENYSYSGNYKTIGKAIYKHLGQMNCDSTDEPMTYRADWLENKPIITNISVSEDYEYFNISFKGGTGLNVNLTDVISFTVSKERVSDDEQKVFAERYVFNTLNHETFAINAFKVNGLPLNQ